MPDYLGWRITYWGLTIKLIAMYGLILVMIIFGLLPAITTARPVPVTMYALLGVLGVDFTGRVSCMAAPNVPRFWLNMSIIVQGIGIAAMLIALMISSVKDTTEWDAFGDVAFQITGLTIAILCQAVAARMFTAFLQQLAISLARQDLMPGLERLRNQVVATGITAHFTVIVLSVAVALFAFLTFFCCGFLAPLAAGPYLVVVFVFAFPIAMACLVLYCAALFSYHINLRAIRKEIAHRAWIEQVSA